MNRRIFYLLILLFAGFSCFVHAEKIDEIKKYFELRDTLSLVNLEMKRALAPDSRSPMLTDPSAEQNLTRLVMFLEGRVRDFAQLNTPLKQHYIRNLNSLFLETRYLYANVLVKIRSKPVNQLKGPVASGKTASAANELQARPYFKPIDLRTLFSPGLLKNEDLKKAEQVWANQMQEKTLASAVAPVAPAKQSQNELFGKTPVTPVTVVRPVEMKDPYKPVAPAMPVAPSGSERDKAGVSTPVEINLPPGNLPEKTTGNAGQSGIKPVEKTTEKPKSAPQSAVIAHVLPKEQKVVSVATKSAVIEQAPAVKNIEQRVEVVPPPVEQIPASAAVSLAPVATVTSQIASGPAAFMRPLAVMIENHRKARPQSGLIDAELVYEMPVEGGITRFMAVFLHLPGVLGPVRSCREYFVDRALEISALYVHCGGSPKGYAYLSKSKINSIDEIKHGKPFYRDNSRKAPHNLYSRGGSLVEYMQNSVPMKLAKKQVPLNYGPVPSVGSQPGTEIFIRYHGNYNTSYKFANGLYERFMNGAKHVDRENGKHIAPGTVILQTANMKTVDSAGRQEISFVGSGSARIFYRGTMIDARWHKRDEKSMTDYRDASGKSVVFDQSKPVWVQVVSPNLKVVINGVDPESKKEEKAAEKAKPVETSDQKAAEKG